MIAFAREFGRAFQLADDYLDGEIPDFDAVEVRLRRAELTIAPLAPANTGLLELVEVLRARCQ